MIDANLNRAREALRTLEDVARFAWNDGEIAAEAKALRHALQAALSAVDPAALAATRDVSGDVGTAITVDGEYTRDSVNAIAQAAGKRLTEALRVLEESLKTIEPRAGAAVEALRYRAYTLDARVTLRASSGALRQWRLCVLLTKALCRHPWEEVVTRAIEGGADAIQVREKDERSARDFVAHARAVRALCAPHGVSLIVNDRLDVALASGADGVHLGVDDLSVRDARRIGGPAFRIGASTHSLGEARAAIEAGADHCGVGAMYCSDLKPGLAPSGEAYLRAYCAAFSHVPHLAIGGIAPGRVAPLARAGCRGLAVSSAVCAAEDPAAVVRALLAELTP